MGQKTAWLPIRHPEEHAEAFEQEIVHLADTKGWLPGINRHNGPNL